MDDTTAVAVLLVLWTDISFQVIYAMCLIARRAMLAGADVMIYFTLF